VSSTFSSGFSDGIPSWRNSSIKIGAARKWIGYKNIDGRELDVHPQELTARTTLPLSENPKVELILNKPVNYGPLTAAWYTDVTLSSLACEVD